MQIQVGQIQII